MCHGYVCVLFLVAEFHCCFVLEKILLLIFFFLSLQWSVFWFSLFQIIIFTGIGFIFMLSFRDFISRESNICCCLFFNKKICMNMIMNGCFLFYSIPKMIVTMCYFSIADNFSPLFLIVWLLHVCMPYVKP